MPGNNDETDETRASRESYQKLVQEFLKERALMHHCLSMPYDEDDLDNDDLSDDFDQYLAIEP